MKIPLSFTLLPTDSIYNNVGVDVSLTGQGNPGQGLGWITPTARQTPNAAPVGLGPALGIAFNGQQIFPGINNVGYQDLEQCNLNACGEHSGGGGGLPHFHMDGFHSQGICYYGPNNYSSTTAHPPLIGFAFDGGWIYGRHLYAGSEGSTVALDNCGGHNHSSAVSYVNGALHMRPPG